MTSTATIALVTGANKGIGLEIGRQLGRRGITVVIGARDPAKGADAAALLVAEGIQAHSVRLDVTDAEAVRSAAAWIDGTFGRLDILVNNAGVALDGLVPPSQLNIDRLRRTFETNVFGVVSVIQETLPLLRRSPAGRIVNLSSSLGSLSRVSDLATFYGQYPLLLAYNTSKTALNAVTVMFAKELADTPIKVNSACPGYCATDLNHHTGPHSPEQGARIAVRLATPPADGPTGQFYDEDGPVPW